VSSEAEAAVAEAAVAAAIGVDGCVVIGGLKILSFGVGLIDEFLVDGVVLLDAGVERLRLGEDNAVLAQSAVDGLVEVLRFGGEIPHGGRGDDRDGEREDGSTLRHFLLSSRPDAFPRCRAK
jgi:hypothetical protein